MHEQTEKSILAASSIGAKYDESVSELFLNKEIVAPILRLVVPEFLECTTAEVISYFETDITSDVPLDDIDIHISNTATEMKAITEKLIRFDTHFTMRNPKLSTGSILVRLHFDLEVQNDYRPSNPAYPLVKRGIYYCARELSAQLGRLTETTDYNDLEKVYSIWICNENVPPAERNTISMYHIAKNDLYGKVTEDTANYDLLSVILIRRGETATEQGILDYLDGVFSSNIGTMKKYSDVHWSKKVNEEVSQMSGLGDSIFTRGQEEGQFTTLYRLVEKQLLNVSQAAQEVGLSEQEFTDRMAAAGYQVLCDTNA